MNSVCGILDGVGLFLCLGHLAVGRNVTVHAPVHIAVEHVVAETAAYARLFDGFGGRVGSAGSNDIDVNAGCALAHDKALLEKGVASSGAVEHFAVLGGVLDDSDLRRVEAAVAVGSGVVEIDAVAGKKFRSLALQRADAPTAVDVDAPRAVAHLCGHAADGHRHVTVGCPDACWQQEGRYKE